MNLAGTPPKTPQLSPQQDFLVTKAPAAINDFEGITLPEIIVTCAAIQHPSPILIFPDAPLT